MKKGNLPKQEYKLINVCMYANNRNRCTLYVR